MAQIRFPSEDSNSGVLVPTYAEIAQYTAGQLPAAPAAGRTRLYADSSDRVQILGAAGGARRVAVHWGSGAAFPTAGALAAGDTFLRTDVGTAGTLYQYSGVAGLGVNGWVAEAPIVCTSTTRPTSGLYTGAQLYETDTGYTWSYSGTGTIWWPVTPSACLGKLWRVGGFSGSLAAQSGAVYYTVQFDTARLTGGFTFTKGASPTSTTAGDTYLTVPLDGMYTVRARGYVSGGSPLTATHQVYVNTGASAYILGNDMLYKPDALDKTCSIADTFPLKAGDKLWLAMQPNAATQYWGTNEGQGVMLSAQWIGPLNGIAPL